MQFLNFFDIFWTWQSRSPNDLYHISPQKQGGDLNRKIQTLGVALLEIRRFQHHASCTCEQRLILHHTQIEFLPIQGNKLSPIPPEYGRLLIRTGEPQTKGVYSCQVLGVVLPELCRALFHKLFKSAFREGVDVVEEFRERVGE